MCVPVCPRPGLRGAVLALSAAAILGSIACKGDEEKPAPVPSAAPTAAGPAAAGAPGMKLLDPGSEPRQELRYSLEPGHAEKITVTLTMGTAMNAIGVDGVPEAAGQGVTMNLPPIRMEVELTVVEKQGDQEARCRFAITGASVLEGGDPAFAATRDKLNQELTGMIGAAGSAILDRRGVARDMALALPPGVDPVIAQMMEGSRQAMEQMSSPLPVEPVGAGARWQVAELVTQSGLRLRRTTQLELVEIDGTHGLLKITISQSADPQVAAMPGLPPGVTAELLSHTGSGSGEVELDLGQLTPPRSVTSLETASSIKVTGGGEVQSMQMKATSRIELGHR